MIVNNVNPGTAIDLLFEKNLIEADDMDSLITCRDRKQQCRELLALLHTTNKPQAFDTLYSTIKEEPTLTWLVKDIDRYQDKEVLEPSQQQIGSIFTHSLLTSRPSSMTVGDKQTTLLSFFSTAPCLVTSPSAECSYNHSTLLCGPSAVF